MRFPAKKNAGCPKAPRDFPPRKDGILHSRSGCLGTSLPLPQSLYGRTDGRMDGRTLTSQPKFFASTHYQISLAMELRWRALPAGSAIICFWNYEIMAGRCQKWRERRRVTSQKLIGRIFTCKIIVILRVPNTIFLSGGNLYKTLQFI